MRSYSLIWDEKLKEIILSYKMYRIVYLKDKEKIDELNLNEISNDDYNLYDLNDKVKFLIKHVEIKNNKIKAIIIYLLSNDVDELLEKYYELNNLIIKTEVCYSMIFNYDKLGVFFDSETGIIKNFEKAMNSEKFKLSDIESLRNISKIEKREDGYYIGENKFLSIKDYNKYANEVFDEMKNHDFSKNIYYTIRHYGPYENINESYNRILELIKKEEAKIIGLPMESFIFGRWDDASEDCYVTNIMIPVELKD